MVKIFLYDRNSRLIHAVCTISKIDHVKYTGVSNITLFVLILIRLKFLPSRYSVVEYSVQLYFCGSLVVDSKLVLNHC